MAAVFGADGGVCSDISVNIFSDVCGYICGDIHDVWSYIGGDITCARGPQEERQARLILDRLLQASDYGDPKVPPVSSSAVPLSYYVMPGTDGYAATRWKASTSALLCDVRGTDIGCASLFCCDTAGMCGADIGDAAILRDVRY
eukprot:2733668-Rhodomonas_salina.1